MTPPPAPRVEMLWEDLDPRHALRGRFGLDDGPAAASWVMRVLAEHWGLDVHRCERIVLSDRNALAWVDGPAGEHVVKWSPVRSRFDLLAEVARLTAWLAGHGLPVSAPVPALNGALQVELDGVSLGLQRRIDGALLDVADPRQVYVAGATLARLQDTLAGYPGDSYWSSADHVPRSLRRGFERWCESRAGHLPQATRDAVRRMVEAAPDVLPPLQLVHHDFRSANVLFAGAEVVAVLDFEEAGPDHRVVELARSAVLLGTRFRQWGPVSSEVRGGFLAGYRSVRELTPVESAWWPALLLWHAFAMVPDGADPTGWGAAAQRDLVALTE